MYRSSQHLVAGLVVSGLALGSVAAFAVAARIAGTTLPKTEQTLAGVPVVSPDSNMPHVIKTVRIPGPAKVIYDRTVFLPTLTLESFQAALHPEWWPPMYVAAGLNDKDAPAGWSPLPQAYVGWPIVTSEVPSEVRHD